MIGFPKGLSLNLSISSPMAEIYNRVTPQKVYVDRKYFSRYEDQVAALRDSHWLYVGNLSFHTTDMQIQTLFSRVGTVKSVIMGVNSKNKTPCGFAFVEYTASRHAVQSVGLLTGTILDNRVIRVELDFGFKNGRHFGRGQAGGQVRDDRIAFDPGRTWGRAQGGDGSSSGEPNAANKSVVTTLGVYKRSRSLRNEEENTMHRGDHTALAVGLASDCTSEGTAHETNSETKSNDRLSKRRRRRERDIFVGSEDDNDDDDDDDDDD